MEIKEKNLTKGQLRKLNALRKSLGQEIADAAFVEWLGTAAKAGPVEDATAVKIEKALNPIVDELRFPRGSRYVVRRGRGRVIVERVEGSARGPNSRPGVSAVKESPDRDR